MRYLFEDYVFDTSLRELHRGADLVSVTPQVFDLLEYLIRNRERLVSKDDLINAVWNGRVVSDAALTTRLNAVRCAIGDSGERQRLVKTLPRKGFRFIGAVQEDSGQTIYATMHSGAMAPTHTSAPRLSIVVLPFANLSDDPAQDYFVDGVTESLTTDMSRISGSFVIGRHTAFTYKDRAVDLKLIGRELNIRYVLEGSVQRNRSRLRVNVQLIDAETGNHLWADRFDTPIADLFDMQDEIVSRLANTLNTQLIEAEARRASRSRDPDAMDMNFQGLAYLNKGVTPEHIAKARSFFQHALTIDPESVGALVGMANIDLIVGFALLSDDRNARLSAAEANATRALSLAPDDASAHFVLGCVYMFTNRIAKGSAECERALVLNPNMADAYAARGLAEFLMGRAAETEGHILEALRLSPRDNFANVWMHCLGRAKIQLGADAEAIDWLRRSIEANRNFPLTHFHLAAALGLVGALDEARAAAKTGLALDPGFTTGRLRVRGRSSDNPAYLAGLERVCQGMLIAGVPEE